MGAAITYLFDPVQGKRRRSRLARQIANTIDTLRPGGDIGSRHGPKSSEWELPMATVNIDIDQGTVTLRGVFPPSEIPEVRATPHRGFTRAPIHLVGDEAETP